MEHYHTFYESMKHSNLTACEEDYIEMLYRLTMKHTNAVRVSDLADALHITSPSVTKMVKKLAQKELLSYERYGAITLTDNGLLLGKTLLKRHDTITAFLELIGVSANLLKDTEKMEHTLSDETLACLEKTLQFFDTNKDIALLFHTYKKALF